MTARNISAFVRDWLLNKARAEKLETLMMFTSNSREARGGL